MFLVLATIAIHDKNSAFINSLSRYLNTYLIIIYSLLLMIYIYNEFKFEKNYFQHILCLMIVMISLQYSNNLSLIYPQYRTMENTYKNYEMEANILKGKIQDDSKVFFVTSQDDVGHYSFIQYYADPLHLNILYYSYVIDKDAWDNEFDTVMETIKEYDYFYLVDYNEEFKERFSYLFDEIAEKSVYKIIKEDKTIRLILLK